MRANKINKPMLVAVAMVLTLTTGCLFDTREADDPGGAGSTWQVPTVPSRVFINLKTGLEELNGVNYEKSIQDDFIFIPLDIDRQQFDPRLNNWTAVEEKAFLQRLLAESSALVVSFTTVKDYGSASPFAEFDVEYTLVRTTNTIPPAEETYEGVAYFKMLDGSKGWQLLEWQDRELLDGGFESWGFLRGILRQ